MKSLQTSEQQRADALVLCALLRAGLLSLGHWSVGLSLLALAGLVAVQPPSARVQALWGLVVLAGLLERYFAFRLALDERLFRSLGRGHLPSLTALDGALHRLGLRAQPLTERPWNERLHGARQLVVGHAFLVLLQTAAAVLSLLLTRFL